MPAFWSGMVFYFPVLAFPGFPVLAFPGFPVFVFTGCMFPPRFSGRSVFPVVKVGGADIFLDHSGSTYIIPKLSLYSTGLMPPKVILIRSSLYQ